MRNFYRIRNMHINMDSIHHFAWHRKTGELWLHDGNPQPIVFTDPDGSLYKALCNYVGNNTSFADNFTGNLRHKVYAVRGNDDPIFVGNFDSYENTLALHKYFYKKHFDNSVGCYLRNMYESGIITSEEAFKEAMQNVLRDR